MEDIYSKVVPVQRMLDNSGFEAEAISKTKETVYDLLVRHILVEGYPAEGNTDFGEANISDLVYIIIKPIISDFIRCQVGKPAGRGRILLRREKVIVSTDGGTGDMEVFVVVDRISVKEEKVIIIIEAKWSSLGIAMKQCMLAIKDGGDNNGEGKVSVSLRLENPGECSATMAKSFV